MPQDSTIFPFIIVFEDTVFAVTNAEEFEKLPDTVKIQKIRYEFEYHLLTNKEQTVIYGSNYMEEKPEHFSMPFFLAIAALAFLIYRFSKYNKRKLEEGDAPVIYQTGVESFQQALHYPGRDLDFTDEELRRICSKYNPYFQKLPFDKKIQFIRRLKGFMHSKHFYIHSSKGYKEMPVLISAAAIQITFGLNEYMLPYFSNIIIHPDAYLAENPLRVLMGNVHGNSISLSWKHFLEDYQNPTDGKNVGLHEMAHALQVQYLFTKRNKSNEFKEGFAHYDRADDQVLQNKEAQKGLFDAHALKDKNELWATSIELFFERPVDLKLDYPELYDSIKKVLNQDPITML
jgi:MtfA peptidase